MPVVKSFKDLSPKKKKFAELYAKTGRVVDSVYNAGFKEGADRTDPKQRALADSLGRTMLRDPLVQQYVAANKPLPVNPNGFIDEPLIVEYMTLILTGKLTRLGVNKKGEQIVLEPTCKDSCEAAKVLLMLKKMQDKQIPVEKRSVVASKRLDELIKSTQFNFVEAEGDEEGEDKETAHIS